MLVNINPLTIIIFSPLLSHVVYPILNRYSIKFGRINRCVLGFTLAWISSIIATLIQWRIYKTRFAI